MLFYTFCSQPPLNQNPPTSPKHLLSLLSAYISLTLQVPSRFNGGFSISLFYATFTGSYRLLIFLASLFFFTNSSKILGNWVCFSWDLKHAHFVFNSFLLWVLTTPWFWAWILDFLDCICRLYSYFLFLCAFEVLLVTLLICLQSWRLFEVAVCWFWFLLDFDVIVIGFVWFLDWFYNRIEVIYGKTDYFGSWTKGLYHMGAVLMFSGWLG